MIDSLENVSDIADKHERERWEPRTAAVANASPHDERVATGHRDCNWQHQQSKLATASAVLPVDDSTGLPRSLSQPLLLICAMVRYKNGKPFVQAKNGFWVPKDADFTPNTHAFPRSACKKGQPWWRRPGSERRSQATRIQGDQLMSETKEPPFSKMEGVSILWGIAMGPPENSRGKLTDQVSACRVLYKTFGDQGALRRLSELAAIERSRTRGSVKGQEAAAKLLDKLLKSIKSDKNKGIQ